MAVKITELCISCNSCVDECPAMAITSADDSPLEDSETVYVKPERCIECVDGSVPKCFDACPTDGAIVWDMPFTTEYNDYYLNGHENGTYAIRTHKKKGLMLPEVQSKPFREVISLEARESHEPLDF